jgi:CubicO group peptidase (beta-lactamase class C family)
MRRIVLIVSIAMLGARASAQDFSELTSLADGAVVGIGVDQPVEGFEIIVLKDGQPLYHQAFGNWTLGQVASADSATKTLSGALVMAVAESGDGGFSLDSRLADFLPEYNKPGYSDITVRQAFSHTSGLPGDDVSSWILTASNITLRQAGFLVSQQPLENGPPGSTFAYGGLSMQAVGAAMEVATGENYIDLFAERIATPLGLSDTRFYIASDTNPRVAGGVETTAADMARFTDMLLNGGVDRATGTRVLSEASVEEMVTRQTTDAQPITNSPTDNNRYGIGVWIDQLGMAGPTVDYLAAGARGMHSWVDEAHGLVFAFATDETSFRYVDVLSSQMHRAILAQIVTPGDFNNDGNVDAADYTVWRDRVGTPADTLPNDIDGGIVGAAQYDTWATNYGRTTSGEGVSVPEPGAAGLALAFLAIGALRRR